MNYFHDNQIRRFLTQFGKIFSFVDVQYGSDPKGNPILHRVPVVYGDGSRQVAAAINNNSSSTMNTVPMITYYISGLEYDQRRTQEPYFIDKSVVRQRTFNRDTGQYETTQGQAFSVERQMPVPYTLRISVDIWTSSHQQRLEIIEQLGVLFNPSLEIQSNDSYFDWTNLSVVYQDGIIYNSRSVPAGSGNTIEVTNWKFWLPIWISGPIKVKKAGMIHKIIASIFKGKALEDMQNDSLLLGTRQKITPYGYQLLLVGNKLQILPASAVINDDEVYTDDVSVDQLNGPDTAVYWHSVLNAYGTIKEGITQIALENEYMTTEIIGTIEYDASDDRMLTFTIDADTLPADTLDPVDMVIDPLVKYPGNSLPDTPTTLTEPHQRYIIVNDIPNQRDSDLVTAHSAGDTHTGISNAWEGLTNGARANDIIEYGDITATARTVGNNYVNDVMLQLSDVSGLFANMTVALSSAPTVSISTIHLVDYRSSQIILSTALPADVTNDTELTFTGTGWFVATRPSFESVDYVTNTTSGLQYRSNEGAWRKSFEGWYEQGTWRLVI
jgi:hypothetical protein